MKILAFNGSPKRDRSDTMHITRAFLAGMDDIEKQEVQLVTVADKRIEYCTGCFSCKNNGGVCIHNDDMAGILEDILKSDLLLFSFPLYSYSFPAPMKALIDRTMPLSSMAMQKVGDRYEHPAQADFSHMKYLMISGCGFPNSRNNFEAVELQFRLLFGEDAAVISVAEAPMFNSAEAAPVTVPFLDIVRQAGREYAQYGAVTADTAALLRVPMIPEDVYADICNRKAGGK